MPLGYFFMANWKKIVLLVLVLMVVAPFALLHLFVLCSRLFEPKLQGAMASTIPTTNGLALRVYRRGNPVLPFAVGHVVTARLLAGSRGNHRLWPRSRRPAILADDVSASGNGL